MRRPRYETEADLLSEVEVVQRMLQRYPFQYTKLGPNEPADYSLHEDGFTYFVVEIKNRTCASARYSTYIISRAKLERLERYARNRNAVPLLAVRWSDGQVGVVRVSKVLCNSRIVIGGRRDRNDPRDVEEMVEFNIVLFQFI